MGAARRGWTWAVAGLGALALPAAAYLAIAFALPWFAPPAPSVTGAPMEAYIVSNGVHTDLVLPVHSPQVDWTSVFPPRHFGRPRPDAQFVAIGWGDREFYLHTPRWRDLTAARALSALSGTGRSLLHVDWLSREELGTRVWRLPLRPAQYAAVVDHVRATLGPGADAVPVPGASYRGSDAFFEARGAYDVVTTCNTWTGDALRSAGVRVSRWTPFAPNVVAHLDRVTSGTPPP